MRNLVIIAAFLFAGMVSAQDVKPTFEKQGNEIVKGTYFHDNGQISQQGFYKNKKLHGEWKAYDTTGKKIAMGQYTNGIKTGKWFFWNGDKLSEVNYDNNTIASVTTWSNKTDVVVNFDN